MGLYSGHAAAAGIRPLRLMAFADGRSRPFPRNAVALRDRSTGSPSTSRSPTCLETPSSYENRAVRTHGQLELELRAARSARTSIRNTFGDRVRVAPVPDVAGPWDSEVLDMVGRDLDVTGVFRRPRRSSCPRAARRRHHPVLEVPERAARDQGRGEGPVATIEQLTTNPARFDGQAAQACRPVPRPQPVRRPARPARKHNRADWVVKDDVYALWVTGRKPKGEGFELDTGLKRDTGKWLEVVGKRRRAPRLRLPHGPAVALSLPPPPPPRVEPPKPPPERPKLPPMIDLRAAARRRRAMCRARRASPSSSARTWKRTASRVGWCCATRAGRSRAIATSMAS